MADSRRVEPFILRRVTGPDDELVGTVRDEGREILLLPLSRKAADECVSSPQYQHLEPVGVTVKDIETVCRNHRLDLVAFCGLEPEELAIVSILPLSVWTGAMRAIHELRGIRISEVASALVTFS